MTTDPITRNQAKAQGEMGPFEPHLLKVERNYECHANCCGLRDEF